MLQKNHATWPPTWIRNYLIVKLNTYRRWTKGSSIEKICIKRFSPFHWFCNVARHHLPPGLAKIFCNPCLTLQKNEIFRRKKHLQSCQINIWLPTWWLLKYQFSFSPTKIVFSLKLKTYLLTPISLSKEIGHLPVSVHSKKRFN